MMNDLRRLAMMATPGPWEHHERDDDVSTVCAVGAPNHPDRPRAVCVSPRYGKAEFDKRDAKFIAAANPQAILKLYDQIEQLRNENIELSSRLLAEETVSIEQHELAEALQDKLDTVEKQVRKDFHAIVHLDIDAMGVVPESHSHPGFPIRDQYLHEMCWSMREVGIELTQEGE